MPKIRADIDLKQLEKFGFEYDEVELEEKWIQDLIKANLVVKG